MGNTAYAKIMTMLKHSKYAFWIHDHQKVGTIDEAHERVPHLTRNLIKTIEIEIQDLIALTSGKVYPISK